MTPRHKLRRFARRDMLQHELRHWQFDRRLPREWRDESEEERTLPWLHWIVYGLAAWVLLLYW